MHTKVLLNEEQDNHKHDRKCTPSFTANAIKKVLKTHYFFQVCQHVSLTEADTQMELDFPNKSYSSAKEVKQAEY